MKDFFHQKQHEANHLPPGYRQGRHANALHTKEGKPSQWKWYAKISVIFITFISALGLLFLHPFFEISSVHIQGLQKIKEEDIRDTVQGILSYKKFYIFPQNNFFVVDIADLHTILREKYPVRSLTVTKNFPHTLNIVLEEKLSTIIYDNGQQYSLMDANGKISEVLRIVDDNEWRVIRKNVTSTNEAGVEVSSETIISRFHTPNYEKISKEVGQFPLVYDTRQKKIGKGEQILDEITVKQIIEWYEILKKNTEIPVSYFYLDQQVGDVLIKTTEGWTIKAKLNDKIQSQFEALQYILSQKVKRPNLQYVDVRFPGRAFWM